MKKIKRTVIKGRNIANKLGFPTANLEYRKADNLEYGVYAAKVIFNKKAYQGLAHIGPSKTFNIKEPRIEVHIFNLSKNLYNKQITIKFLKKIRNSKKFDSEIALINQIKKDITTIHNL